MNEEQEFLSFEECREQIIKLGKFEFRDNRWISHNTAVSKTFKKSTLLKNSCIFNIEDLPENVLDQEIIYHILWEHKKYLDSKCPQCGKKLKFIRLNVGYQKYCSVSCKYSSEDFTKYKIQRYKEKTGYENPSQNPEVVSKKKKNSLEKWGTEWPLGNIEVQQKRRLTSFINTGYEEPLANPEFRKKYNEERFERTGYYNNMQNPEGLAYWLSCYKEKTGYDHPAQNPEIREKAKQTYLEKTGYSNPSQNPEIINFKKQNYEKKTGYSWGTNPETAEKRKNTNIEKYGVSYIFQSQEMLKKSKQTYFERTGYCSPGQNPEVKEKSKQTYFEKTGYEHPMKNPDHLKERSIKYKEKTGYDHPGQNPEVIIKRVQTNLLENNRGYSKISQKLFWDILHKLPIELQDHVHFAEKDKEYVWTDSENKTCYFYDFIITTLKLIIEFDGVYWHGTDSVKERDLQKQKFIENKGYILIRVTDKEYIQNKEKVIEYCLKEINILYSQVTNNKMVC